MTVVTQLSFVQALDKLRYAQKSAKGAPAYSRFVNRKAGRVLAAAAYRIGATPNQVTAVSALFTYAAIAVVALVPPAPAVGVIITALLVVGYALDAADGQLARLRGGGSAAGEWLDHVVDAAKISALHLAVLIAAYQHFDVAPQWLLVPIGFTVVAAVMFFAMILNDLLRRATGAGPTAPPGAKHSAVRSILVVPTDYGLLCITFLTFGFPTVFGVVYTGLFAANAAFLALALVKWFREAGRLDVDRGGAR
ncbi:CDP-alcohol phosphatidyltransferase family protein [Thermocrispum sp.]|uniref:CDP-alcohol phosphatidyltransferase family protein n=1 Tax=Thermocrispum agreste TaxID=37925 RepID=A0ABD6FB97_9PSEU|nr:CDP-alcohol phosphatidyltransferase family protein [Thermocrispum sp.]